MSRPAWNSALMSPAVAMMAVPCTTMGYAGVKDPKERADLIAFLVQQSDGPVCAK